MAAAVAGLVLGGIVGGGWIWSRATAAVPQLVVRFSIDLPPGEFFRHTWNAQLTFSPDGRTLGNSHRVPKLNVVTFLRQLDKLENKQLTDLAGGPLLAFSPDGRFVVLQQGMGITKGAVTGGAAVDLAPADMPFRGDWAPDNHYYWTSHYFGPIVRTPIAGGESEPVTQLDMEKRERTHRHAQVLPGGKAMIFTVAYGGIESFDDARIEAFEFATRRRKTLVQGGFGARYAPSGHLVYARGGNLYAVPSTRPASK